MGLHRCCFHRKVAKHEYAAKKVLSIESLVRMWRIYRVACVTAILIWGAYHSSLITLNTTDN